MATLLLEMTSQLRLRKAHNITYYLPNIAAIVGTALTTLPTAIMKEKYEIDYKKVQNVNRKIWKVKLVIGLIGLLFSGVAVVGMIWFATNYLGDGIGAVIKSLLNGVKK